MTTGRPVCPSVPPFSEKSNGIHVESLDCFDEWDTSGLCLLFHSKISTFTTQLVVTACLRSITINHALSITTDLASIEAVGCDIHYSGALVLGGQFWFSCETVPALPNLECLINMIIATLFVI